MSAASSCISPHDCAVPKNFPNATAASTNRQERVRIEKQAGRNAMWIGRAKERKRTRKEREGRWGGRMEEETPQD
jgi:hypothetical protein